MLSSGAKVANQVAVDSDGNIFVADSSHHCIQKFTALGEPLVEVAFDSGEISGIAIYKLFSNWALCSDT